jgi:hypothetical protein
VITSELASRIGEIGVDVYVTVQLDDGEDDG